MIVLQPCETPIAQFLILAEDNLGTRRAGRQKVLPEENLYACCIMAPIGCDSG
jgi:hypothetical protein